MLTRPTIYTEEMVLTEVTLILETLQSNPEIVYLGELLEGKSYGRTRYSEWGHKYEKNQELLDTMDLIKDILESRAATGAMKNKLSANFTKFHLINNHGWKDKSEQEMYGKDGAPLFLPSEVLNKNDLNSGSKPNSEGSA